MNNTWKRAVATAVGLVTMLTLAGGIAACGTTDKPAPHKDKPVATEPVVGTPNCTERAEKLDWVLPVWKNACQFTNESLLLMLDAGGFTDEDIDIVMLDAKAGPTKCSGQTMKGDDLVRILWCQEESYMLATEKSMTDSAENDGHIGIFGAILSAYSDNRLYKSEVDPSAENNACTSGTVMQLLVNQGVLTRDEAVVIGEDYFADHLSTFETGLDDTCALV